MHKVFAWYQLGVGPQIRLRGFWQRIKNAEYCAQWHF